MGSELPSNESELGSFAVLPREIRDKIYAYALTIPARGFSKPYHSYHPSKQDLWRLERQSGLWIVCTSRQIHAESLPVLYQRNTFVLSVDDATSEATDVKLHRAASSSNVSMKQCCAICDDWF
ncbi:hypothetical protein FH972_023701 [Carpinus fangiana]|uniref:Uncharacterized protein n=1 Tax=Carpinus fangiana TaxID=176857 RepID=A0A5N6KVY2_9ROSI|nr:hypothetical protein FH972_023701 [Carpinus fangiana]